MIRVRKCDNAPEALKTAYNHEDVCKQLLEDQDDKCYLCERHVTTNYQVEHYRSRNHAHGLVKEWTNLYVSCEYCNGKKSDSFDNILQPNMHNIEAIIQHENFFSDKNAVFSSEDTSISVLQTIELLTRLFNGKKIGTKRIRNFKEERFYEEYRQKINIFLKAIDEYISTREDKYREIIEEQLDIKKEFLGFKYAIIQQNPLLKREFGHLTVWNKQ